MDHKPSHTSSEYLADDDLARRSRMSGVAYLVLFGIIIFFTPYADDHPWATRLVSALILLSALARALLIFRFDRLYPRNPSLWLHCFTVFSLALAATWGLFCAHTVLHYSLQWTAMLTLLSTAGIASGAITTLSIRKPLSIAFLTLLLLPPTIASVVLPTRESSAVTLMFVSYYVFMFIVATNIHAAYWRAINNALLLDSRSRELEASNQELESYSYSIAHDLRTPLRSIIGFSQILQDKLGERLSDDETDLLDRIVKGGKRMAALLDDILQLSRITRRELAVKNIDLSALAQAQVAALRQAEPQRSVDIQIQPGMRATADPRLLAVALQNLLENAWKFTGHQESAEISFSCEKSGQQTLYCLSDNGVGFDMIHAGKLFKPFERLQPQDEFPGTGIGLATVQRVIQRHGGDIWVQSSPGEGSRFYFTLEGKPTPTG